MVVPANARTPVLAAGGLAVVCLSVSAPACRSGSGAMAPDLIVRNARVWTVDPSRPEAEAVAIRGDRISALGSTVEIDRLRGPATRVIDAGGRFLMPGFHDSHVHLMTGGAQLDNVDLRTAATPEEFARRIGERAKATAAGEWITGGDWDEQQWPAPALPTRELIDAVTPGTPVFVNRYDEHMALANTEALRLAGLTAQTPDVPGGVIVRDSRGRPTGVLKDAAMGYVQKLIPPPSRDRRERTLGRALRHMASLGVTSVQDMGPDEADVELYADMAATGRLTARIRVVPPALRVVDRLHAGSARRAGTPWLSISGAKTFADGSLGSTTALFFEPYTDDPSSRGLLADEMLPPDAQRARLLAIDKAGEQLCIHAIGDRAISMVLDLVAEISRLDGPRDRRVRIEHSQHVAPGDFARYAGLHVIASVQPYHAIDDGKWAERRIGAERAKTTYAFQSFLDHGVRLAFGSDWPVAPLDPALGLYAAVTRATLDGKRPGGWVPEQKIGVADAIAAYTMGAAYAGFVESERGSVTTGKLADLVLLAEDPFRVPPQALRDLKVVLTIAGGKVVFER